MDREPKIVPAAPGRADGRDAGRRGDKIAASSADRAVSAAGAARRKDRLGAALRENLARRKAQARAREASGQAGVDSGNDRNEKDDNNESKG